MLILVDVFVVWKNCSGLSCLCRCGVICFCWYCCGVICCCKCPVRSYFRSYINERKFLFIYRQGKKVMKMSEQSKISWLICVFTEMLKWILFSWGPRRWNRRFHRCFSSGFATASSVTDEIDGSFFFYLRYFSNSCWKKTILVLSHIHVQFDLVHLKIKMLIYLDFACFSTKLAKTVI